jgi:hypothetical protein
MTLLSWVPSTKDGALLGRAKILLPSGLEIDGIGLFQRPDGARWAQMPSEIMRDADGQPLTNEAGKIRYRTPIRWASRDLQQRFSEALFALVDASTKTAEKISPVLAAASPQRGARRRQGKMENVSTLPPGRLPSDTVDDLWREEIVP